MANLPETTRALFRTFGTRGEDRASRLWLEACLAKTHGLAQVSALGQAAFQSNVEGQQ